MTNCTGRLDEVRAARRSNWKSGGVIVSAGFQRAGKGGGGVETGLSWIPACQTGFYTVLISCRQRGGVLTFQQLPPLTSTVSLHNTRI